MNQVLASLLNHYGQEYSQSIQKWLSVEMYRSGTMFGDTVLVRDAKNEEIIRVLMQLINEFNLSATELVTNVYLLPAISEDDGELTVYPEITSALIADAINSTSDIRIKQFQLVKAGDLFEKYGQFSKPTYVQHNKNGEILSAFVFGSFSNQIYSNENWLELCVWLEPAEIESIANTILTTKLNGIEVDCPFVIEQQIYSALLYRLYSESCFARAKSLLPEPIDSKFDAIRARNTKGQCKREIKNAKVRNRHNMVIGHKVQYYSLASQSTSEAVEKAKSLHKSSLKVINGGKDTKPSNQQDKHSSPQCDDTVATDFGMF